ncbi:hypothetical protein F0562_025346 [Nyssa sinensis]|uniref:EF-hand domain-containing protein n=1 Tax=Nyssa sinensis TaxID=561372 RepID=A0A5J5BF75_9ASTE|nr:hypothetical protein F0562_025346 [Nyssa sinensis]
MRKIFLLILLNFKMDIVSCFNKMMKKKKPVSSTNPSREVVVESSSSSSMAPKSMMEELEQVFKTCDADGDGNISPSELVAIMRKVGSEPTEEQVQLIMAEYDRNGDGLIDFNEFMELNTKGFDSDEFLKVLKSAFSIYDVDKDGFISANELQKTYLSLGKNHSMEDCKRMISAVDSDGDGMVNFEEFKAMMMGSDFNSS